MIFILIYRNARITLHTMSEIDTKTLPLTAGVTERTVVYMLGGGIIIEFTDGTNVLRKMILMGAIGVDTGSADRLEGTAVHAYDFADGVTVEYRDRWCLLTVAVRHNIVGSCSLALLMAADSAGEERSGCRVAKFAGTGIVFTAEDWSTLCGSEVKCGG